ncbi:DEAD/DEAH box helicase, partial [Bifidobacterium longum]
GSKESDRKYVFATVQTMSRPETLAQFDADEFDYILVDEVHHAAAESYKRVIDHFQPNFMLGMTATPERTDGANIFELFGNNVAYEIRLQKALEEDMLCPFHYYGVHEYIQDAPDEKIDGKDVKVESMTDQERNELSRWLEELADPNRVRYIIDKIQIYSEAGTPVQGLVFCSRREEAKRLSDLFNQQMNQQAERPYRTKAITGENSQMERDTAVAQLENGELDYIFTVDLFNEGVDIPHVNQIVMLRQTKSSIIFTQQLGRGLRKANGKDCVVVIDFIGNYANNYLIPIALYGNTGDRDVARKNLQRETIGISSISFDKISRERVLASLDTADLSNMKLLSQQYQQMRYELGRIPMLMDFARRDVSLVFTMASKNDDY